MSDPSGTTAWKYDARGRVIQETKVVNGTGGGTFITQWSYNSHDQVATMTYPGGSAGQLGEAVTTIYGKWGQPTILTGTDSIVSLMPFDTNARIDQIKLGGTSASPTLVVDYSYHPWNTVGGRGRLQQINSGPPPPGNPGALQNLTYGYDAAGNVTSLVDGVAPAETLGFAYDALDRLTAVSNAYSRSYTYDQIGNLTSKTSSSTTYYSYDSAKVHAAKTVKGTGGTAQMVTVWAKRASTGGAAPQIRLRVNGVDYSVQDVTATSYTAYNWSQTLSGNDILNVWYINGASANGVYIDRVVVNGVTVQAEGGAMVYDRGTGSAALDGLDVVVAQELMDADGTLRFVRGGAAYAAGYDPNGNMSYRCVQDQALVFTWDEENRLTRMDRSTGNLATFVYRCDGLSSRAGCIGLG